MSWPSGSECVVLDDPPVRPGKQVFVGSPRTVHGEMKRSSALLVAFVVMVSSSQAGAIPPVSSERPVEDRETITDHGRRPAVASGSGASLVVWEAAVPRSRGIFGAYVQAGYPGEIDDRRFAISASADEPSNPAVAWGEPSFLVVWESSKDGGSIVGARVTDAGDVLDPAGITIGSGSAPSVAWNGSHFLVVSESAGEIVGARVTDAGDVLDPAGIAIGSGSAPSVTSGASTFLVAWEDAGTSLESDIHAARVSDDGQILDPGGIEVSTADGAQRDPAVAWSTDWRGSRFVTVWWDETLHHLRGARISDTGEVLDPDGFRAIRCCLGFYQAGEHPSVAWDGTVFLVVSEYAPGSSGSIVGALVFADGCEFGCRFGFQIPALPDQSWPALAFGGSRYLVVWIDEVHAAWGSAGFILYGARLTASGDLLDPRPFEIARTRSSWEPRPSVAWDGSVFLVTWVEAGPYTPYGDDFIRAARVSESSEVLDPGGIEIARGSVGSLSHPKVASSGNGFLVAYSSATSMSLSPDERAEAGSRGSTISGVRIAHDGTASEPAPIGTAPAGQAAPGLAWNGSTFLVVWLADRSGYVETSPSICSLWCEPTVRGVHGVRVSERGVALDPAPIPIATFPPAVARSFCTNHPVGPSCVTPPSVAGTDDGSLVVWGMDSVVTGARVTSDGLVLDPNGIVVGDDLAGRISAARHGDGFLVAWARFRDITTGLDVVGARVSPSGQVLDPDGFPLAHSSALERQPALAATAAIAYVRGGNPPPGRIFVRLIG